MKFFTLLGKGRYEECLVHFQGQEDHCDCCKYLQKHIYETYIDEIDGVYVFCTPEAEKAHWESLCQTLNGAPLKMIPIKSDMTSEEFASLLIKQVEEGEEIIFDVTHGFRELPIKVLFILKSIEMMKNAKVRHIYYGLLSNKSECISECIIKDIMEDYKTQKISELLGQFDRTLIMTEQDWKDFAGENDKIRGFMTALTNFNNMIEYCKMDKAAYATEEVRNRAKNLLKDPETNIMLIPLAQRIKDKLPDNTANPTQKMINLIQLLLEHKRYQVAITFADQYYARLIVRKAAGTDRYDYLNNKLPKIGQKNFAYTIESYIRNVVANQDKVFLNPNDDGKKYLDYSGWNEKAVETMRKIYRENSGPIKTLHRELRNSINHGAQISVDEEKIKEVFSEYLDVLTTIEAI